MKVRKSFSSLLHKLSNRDRRVYLLSNQTTVDYELQFRFRRFRTGKSNDPKIEWTGLGHGQF